MTASAQIVGTVRGVPDSASISLDSGTSVKGTSKGNSTKSDFHSVLEQYHASRENASETDDAQGTAPRKQKDSDSATSLAIPQPVTHAVEAPRLVLPFTTSTALRQDATSPPDDTAAQDATASADDIAAQDSTAAADPNAAPSVIANTSLTPAILRSMLDLRGLLPVSDVKATSATSGTTPKTQAKLQAKSKDPAPSPAADSPLAQNAVAPLSQITQPDQTAPADPSIPIQVTSATTLEQAVAALQNSSTVNEAPGTVGTSTSDRAMAYQYRSSDERSAKTAVINRASQEPQKVSDPTPAVAAAAAVTLPVSLMNPVTNTVEPQSSLHPAPGVNMPRQGAKALDSASGVPQDSSAAAGNDSKNTLPPAIQATDGTSAASNAGTLAFAARLTPTTELQPPASESTRPAELSPGSQTPPQTAAAPAAKQISTGADLPADARSGDGGGQLDREKAGDLFAKPEALLPQMHVADADQTAAPANNSASTGPLSPAAQMDKVIDPPAAAPKTNNDITVRLPDSTDQGTAVRFVERAGEIHVSVRTGDVEIAQSLRGGLNDLVNRLEDGGIRTEVWQPGTGSNGEFSQSDSHQFFADPDGSNGRQYSSGSNSEQESKQQNKPRWVEELEGSIGNQNPKETPQLLWQA